MSAPFRTGGQDSNRNLHKRSASAESGSSDLIRRVSSFCVNCCVRWRRISSMAGVLPSRSASSAFDTAFLDMGETRD